MSQLLPRKPPVERPDDGARVVGLDDGDSGAVFSVLSAAVARGILTELYRTPATQSELADRVDTSIQNVDYHLDKLVMADLVDVVDQWYSEKGIEMDVYAPTGDPLVLVAGDCAAQDDPTDAIGSRRSTGPAPNRGE